MRYSAIAVLVVCSLLALPCYAVDLQHKSSSLLRQRLSSTPAVISTIGTPKTSLSDFQSTGVMDGDDFLSQVRLALSHELANLTKSNSAVDPSVASFLELGQQVSARAQAQTGAQVKKLQPFCEMCILVMQMKERGQPHLCAGLNDNNYITCVEVLISLIRADKALVYWLKTGCMHISATGPEIVQPCPALNICSWVPNLFAQPTSVVQDGVESLCPRDSHFLPTVPQEYKDLLAQQQQASTH